MKMIEMVNVITLMMMLFSTDQHHNCDNDYNDDDDNEDDNSEDDNDEDDDEQG